MTWAVYYADGSRVTDQDVDSPWELDGWGVQIIAQPDPTVGRVLLQQDDHYWYDFEREEWFGGDLVGLLDATATRKVRVVHGRTVSNDEWEELYQRALEDDYLPPKSADHRYRER